MKGFADAYQKKSGVTVSANYVDHNTFQESITTYPVSYTHLTLPTNREV